MPSARSLLVVGEVVGEDALAHRREAIAELAPRGAATDTGVASISAFSPTKMAVASTVTFPSTTTSPDAKLLRPSCPVKRPTMSTGTPYGVPPLQRQ